MIEFEWKFVYIALVCVLAASFVAVAPYAAAQVTITSNSLFVGDQTTCGNTDCTSIQQFVKLVNIQGATGVTSNFATTNINGPRGIIFAGGDSPALLVANQVPNTNLRGDIAKYDPSNGTPLGFLVPQSDPNAPNAPRGIVLSPNHSVLYVADICQSFPCSGSTAPPGLIRTYNANNGHFIASYSAQALLAANGDQFNPRGVVFGPDGKLYVSVFDARNPNTGYILKFDPSTSQFSVVVQSDAANNYDGLVGGAGMHRPEGIVFDSTGNLWVTSFCVKDKQGDCDSTFPRPQTSSTNVDKIIEFGINGKINTIPLESSTKVPRTFAQAILFGANGNLYVPITNTGELRVCDTTQLTIPCAPVAQSGSPLVQPWYLSFRGTDPSTLAFTTSVSALSSSPSSLSSTQAPSNTQPIPSQPNFRPFQP
jgi:hypothetical protein